MKYPLPASNQHTRCLLALTMIQTCMSVLTPVFSGLPLEKNAKKINHWIVECSTPLKNRKLSSGAKRDLDAVFGRIAPHIETADMEGDERFAAWAANVWAAWTMIVDVRITSKDFAHGLPWAYLERTTFTLAKVMEAYCPACDEKGTDIYMDVA